MKYPLEQLETIKKKRLEEAERALVAAKEKLQEAEETLKEKEKVHELALKHQQEKIDQLRDEINRGTTSDKIEQAGHYLTVVEEDVEKKKKKVEEQQEVVKQAKEAVELARQELVKKQQDVEKIRLHRKEWEHEMRLVEKQKEGVQNDELGSAMHILRRKRGEDG
ncbi:MAG: hypothetical protein SNF33_05160 [Candidatus Algichlamydia australiensis]|nr:hypothetical protein [Chlamydiales bacterium]